MPEGTPRWVWIVGGAVAAATVVAFWFLEQWSGQQGVFVTGILIAAAEIVFLGGMNHIMGQTRCENCGIGNLADADTCWSCGEPLGRPDLQPQPGEQAHEQDQPGDGGHERDP